MSEKALAGHVMKALKPADGVRVENGCGRGTPDVNYTDGWIELKQQDNWPKKPETPLKLSHDLTLEQRIWLTRREEKGGLAFVLMQVDRDYLLLSGGVAANIIGEATQAQLKEAAIAVWTSTAELKRELLPCLRRLN
jgi:hypothetical protein